jgi:Protein of unknown function (DUF1761)
MGINFLAILVAALCTLPIGFIYYHKAVFGGAWMRMIGKTEAELMPKSMVLQLLVSVIFAFLIAFAEQFQVIHQMHLFSLMADDPTAMVPGSDANNELMGLLAKFGDKFRTFGHGAFHGVLTGVFFVLPIIGVTNLYERRSFKLTLVQSGYWIITLAVMGGIICAWR